MYAGRPWSEVGPLYRKFRERIHSDRDKCVNAARMAYLLRYRRKNQKAELLRSYMVEADKLLKLGYGISFISKSMNRSVRTIYRWRRKNQKRTRV